MKRITSFTATLFGLTIQALAHSKQAAPATLTIGSVAPPITVEGWLRGSPIGTFEPGKRYVVEFWATWCGPCVANMPHLTKIAKRYEGKVSVVGISVLESRGAYPTLEKVRQFVDKMGDKIGYATAFDGAANRTFTDWMTAAAKDSIPCSFVVDTDGTIAWMGHPSELDPILAALTEGRFDREAVKKKIAEQQATDAKWQEYNRRALADRKAYDEAVQAKDYKRALRELTVLEQKQPIDSAFDRFLLYIKMGDPTRAYAHLETRAKDPKRPPFFTPASVGVIMSPEVPEARRNYALALRLFKLQARPLNELRTYERIQLAQIYFGLKRYPEAIKQQSLAIEDLVKSGGDQTPPEYLKKLRETLERYRKADTRSAAHR